MRLLDPEQPVFVLAAVHLGDAHAERLASGFAGPSDEAHYTRLRRSGAGRRRILSGLGDAALTAESVRVSALHKPFMAVGKLVDLLIEPTVAEAGGDLYADDWHLKILGVLQSLGPTACPQYWHPMLEAFVHFVWRGTPQAAVELARLLTGAVQEAGDHPVGEFLDLAPRDPMVLLAWHGREEGDEPADSLDPALTSMVEQALWWGNRRGPFLLRYDESKLVGRWTERLLALADPEVAAAHNVTPTNSMPTIQLAGLSPTTSHDSPAVQVADCVAGACGELLRGFANGKEATDWELSLREARPLRFLDWISWPPDRDFAIEWALERPDEG